MDDTVIRRLTDELWQRLSEKPRALCIGRLPEGDWEFLPVSEPPWDMVVLASLTPAELLSMPTDPVCRSLLEGKPVYLREAGLEHRNYPGSGAKALLAMLCARERQLRSLGVRPLERTENRRLYTASDVRRLLSEGGTLPHGCRLTPLAKDIWEGKA